MMSMMTRPFCHGIPCWHWLMLLFLQYWSLLAAIFITKSDYWLRLSLFCSRPSEHQLKRYWTLKLMEFTLFPLLPPHQICPKFTLLFMMIPWSMFWLHLLVLWYASLHTSSWPSNLGLLPFQWKFQVVKAVFSSQWSYFHFAPNFITVRLKGISPILRLLASYNHNFLGTMVHWKSQTLLIRPT